MTVAFDVVPAGPVAAVSGVLRAGWRARLRWHAAVLLLAMAGVGAFIGVHSTFTDDSTNVILQAEALAHGHWAIPDPFPQVDPHHQDFAAENVGYTAAGFAPLAKHLTYTILIAPVVGLFGSGGLMALSMLGTVLAALCSARLARLYAPGHERTVFWATAVASPLFFYGFVYTGQTVGAAAVAVAMVAGLAYLRTGRLVALLGAGLAMGVGVAAREESMIWCGAACLASPLLIRRRGRRTGHPLPRVGLLVVSLAGGGFLARASDLILAHRLLASSQPVSQQASALLGGNTVANQFRGFFIAAAGPGQGFDPFSQTRHGVLAVTVAGLALTAVAARMLRNREPAIILSVAAGGAAALFPIRTLLEPTSPVAGLLPAFPLLWAGLWLMGRAEIRSPEARWALGAGVIFAAGVAASVYSDGGGLQWGGRYFGVGLPVVLPLVVAAIGRHGAAVSGRARQILAVCLVAATAATGWQTLATLTTYHRAGSGAMAELAAAAPLATPGDHGKPVVVSTSDALGTLFAAFPDYRMLRVTDSARLTELGLRLRAAGVNRIILAGYTTKADELTLAGTYRVLESIPDLPSTPGWSTAVLIARAG